MEKYVKPEMEVVEFETQDVIMASGCASDGPCNELPFVPFG